MLLGVDFGLTRTVVAVAEKKGYSVVGFRRPGGKVVSWYSQELATEKLQDSDQLAWLAELTSYFTQLYSDLRKHSTLTLRRDEPLAVWLAISPLAGGNQRFAILEAVGRAGFQVLGLMDQPLAISQEYRGNLASKGASKLQEDWLNYHLSDQAFVCSRLTTGEDSLGDQITAQAHLPIGANDFDRILSDLVLEQLPKLADFTEVERSALLALCRQKREQLHPNTRKITVEVDSVRKGAGDVSLEASAYYQRCTPLVEQTLAVVDGLASNGSVYLTGEGSEFPLVSRLLRNHLGRRFQKADQPAGTVALGLARGRQLPSPLGWFGIWREENAGQGTTFDPLFTLTGPASPGAVLATRTYQPAHNLGHYRYLVCSHLSEGGIPAGIVTLRGDLRFPLDPALATEQNLQSIPVTRVSSLEDSWVEEVYQGDEEGTVQVTFYHHRAGYSRCYRLA